MCVFLPLPSKEYKDLKPHELRVLNLDPAYIYARIKVDHFKRNQSISIAEMFPNTKGICGCGCDAKLHGRRTRWATDECQSFAVDVNMIINGRPDVISSYLRDYFVHWACCKCGEMDKYVEYKNGLGVSAIHKDHIVPVHKGGGGCWLSNYQLLCDICHKEKTLKERNC